MTLICKRCNHEHWKGGRCLYNVAKDDEPMRFCECPDRDSMYGVEER